MTQRPRTSAYVALVALGLAVIAFGGTWWFVGLAFIGFAVALYVMSRLDTPGGTP